MNHARPQQRQLFGDLAKCKTPTTTLRRFSPPLSVLAILVILVLAPSQVPAADGADETAPRLSVSSLLFLSAQHVDDGSESTELLLKRGHLDFRLDLGKGFLVRVTPDLTIDGEGEADAPIKFAYARWQGERLGVLHRPFVALGRVPTPWIGFAEGINRYRMQDGTFLDRLGFFSSADEGVAVAALLGPPLPDEVHKRLGGRAPGRWGSLVAGIYSGSGFKATNRRDGGVLQGRLSLRPLPDTVPGLQFSALAVRGEGNTAAGPQWTVDAFLASWQALHLVASIQSVHNTGNQSGTWVGEDGDSLRGKGWSAFLELRQSATAGWAAFARYDHFDQDRSTVAGDLDRSILGLSLHQSRGNAVLVDIEYLEEAGQHDTWRAQLTLQLRLGPWEIGTLS